MTTTQWAAVDQYLNDLLIDEDPVLASARAASEAAGLPPIAVTPAVGKLLHLLARSLGARRILEIGTLGGYSTIWLARALPPDGTLITLEAAEAHAEVARANITAAGLDDRVELRLGPALVTLPMLAEERTGPFDLIFIDADKPSNSAYFTWALRLARPGSVIIVDNVVRDGAVLDPDNPDPAVQGTRRFLELVAGHRRVAATTLQTVGAKGWDGFTLAIVTED